MAKIGVVGAAGCVGGACVFGFQRLGHQVFQHDLRLGTKLAEVLDSEAVYVAVPTKRNDDGSCDTSIVEQVVAELIDSKFLGLIVIKSTVEPGLTDRLNEMHKTSTICFCPEFLRERSSFVDFQNQDILVVGTEYDRNFEKVKSHHGQYFKQAIQLKPKIAECVKLFNNSYNATLITFANSFYEICQGLGVDYTEVKNAMVKRDHVVDIYLDANPNLRGFGGMCLPKDVASLAHLADKFAPGLEFFQDILDQNAKFKTTVFPGMRAE